MTTKSCSFTLSQGEGVNIKARSERLTPREREVVGWLAQDESIQEVSAILDVSSNTTTTHNANAAGRLGGSNHMELSSPLTAWHDPASERTACKPPGVFVNSIYGALQLPAKALKGDLKSADLIQSWELSVIRNRPRAQDF
jgi:DNA-binding CsgD family transcriptional regulator